MLNDTADVRVEASTDFPTQQIPDDVPNSNLKARTASGALASTLSQTIAFCLRLGSMMVLARLLLKEDFGLVNMVTPFTGFLSLFRDAGLSMATVQRRTLTRDQASTLFWINVGFGLMLWLGIALASPFIAEFYKEPRLSLATIVLGSTFLFNGISSQHRAMLSRQMRLAVLSVIDIVALVLSIAMGIGMAAIGSGYKALVAMTATQPAAAAIGLWLATGWLPGRPRRRIGVRSMLSYGGSVTLTNVIVYLAYNADKVLLGRFFGAEQLGVYGRAYQLITIPSDNLSQAMGAVAFPAMSRVHNEPERLRRYFISGYKLLLSLAVPTTASCALFAHDIIRIFLGPDWREAADIFRLLAPTVLALALINPFGWLTLANGRPRLNLGISLIIAPVVFIAYLLGLRHGLTGVALAYSVAMFVLVAPVIVLSRHGTLITGRDVVRVIAPLLGATAIAATIVILGGSSLSRVTVPLLRLVVECALFFGVYILVLLFVLGDRSEYLDVLRSCGLWSRPSI